MSDTATLERRLEAVERAIADIQDRLANPFRPSDWLRNVAGSISDEAAFLEALEYGRAFRQAGRPPEEGSERS